MESLWQSLLSFDPFGLCDIHDSLVKTYEDELEAVTHIGDNLLPPKQDLVKRSEEASDSFRQMGNEYFMAAEKMDKAAWCYTRALYAAPKDSPSLALAHGNRAAALFKLGKLEAAYYDCECALKLKHPRTNVILFRQAAIASAQRNASGLKDCIEKLEGLEIVETVAVERLKKLLEEVVVPPQQLEAPTHELNYKGLASGKKVSIMRSRKLGRYVVAEEPIDANALIFVEDAAAFSLDDGSYRYVFLEQSEPVNLLCDNCLEHDIVPFPCYDCCAVFYCSRTCQESDASLHAIECKAYQAGMFYGLRYVRLPLRCLIAGFDELLYKAKSLLGKKKCRNLKELWSILLRAEDDGSIFGLHSDFSLYQQNFRVWKYAIVTSTFSNYLFDETQFFAKSRRARREIMSSDRGWRITVSALLLRLLGKVSVSAANFQYFRSRFPSASAKGELHKYVESKVSLDAAYVLTSKLNHSCDPNAVAILFGSKVHLIAGRDISMGEELRISYIPCGDNSYAARNHLFRGFFGFCCDCAVCEKKDDSAYVTQNQVVCSRGCGAMYVPFKRLTCPRCGNGFDPVFYNRFNLMNEILTDSISKYKCLYNEYQNMCYFLPPGSAIRTVAALNILEGYLQVRDPSIFDDQQLNSQMLRISIDYLAHQSVQINQFEYLTKACVFMDVLARRKFRHINDIDINSNISKIKRIFELLDGSLLALLRNYFETYLSWINT